ncbi:MAG: ABC transporter ATP-binding protein [Actinobacteria bacterium]|nr:MAG: ABC transporter ATP-binding protein [Actinomycetota bacterium]
MPPILELRGLRVRYGAIEAVKGISLTVGHAEIVTLIGGNGAGKTTTLKAISSVLRPAAGEILFEGERTDRLPSHEVVRRGICQAPEGRRIFPRMSVKDNLEMGAYARRDTDGIGTDFDRALMAHPKLLLLDEPSMGLAPMMVDRIFEVVREINAQGTPILLVEQNAQMALQTARRGYVLESGSVVLEDEAAVLLGNDQVRKSYLGTD